jgi:hypothetical protein
MAWFSGPPTATFLTDTAIPMSMMPTMTNYVRSDLKGRGIRSIAMLDERAFINYNIPTTIIGASDRCLGFYILVTGAATSASAVVVTMNYQYEYLPSPSGLLIANLDYPKSGPMTITAINSILRMHPGIVTSSYEQARDFLDKLPTDSCCDYNELLATAMKQPLMKNQKYHVPEHSFARDEREEEEKDISYSQLE